MRPLDRNFIISCTFFLKHCFCSGLCARSDWNYLLEFQRSADEPRATWNVLFTTQRGRRSRSPVHPRSDILSLLFTMRIGSPFLPIFPFSTLLFPIHRMNHLPLACAPSDPTRPNASTIPIRLAQPTALEPEVEIQGTAGTLGAAWTRTVMERYDQPASIRDSKICKHFLRVHLKHETFLIAKHNFGLIW